MRYPHLPPAWLPIHTHQSIITRPISPLIVQTMQASLLNLISPFYLLFTKNSLARPRNYVVITEAGREKKNITDIPFLLSVCLKPLLSTTRCRYMCLQRDFLMGGYLPAWFCLSRRLWTSVELKISQHLIAVALVRMRPFGGAANCQVRACAL